MNNYIKTKSIIITLIGIALTIYGFILCVISNLNLGVVLVLVLGLVLLTVGIFYNKIKKYSDTRIYKSLKFLFFFAIISEIILVSFIAVYGVYDTISYDEDAVIVLGAGIHGDKVSMPLKMRLDKAIEYHKKNPDALIVVSGGQGFQETVTEAYAMEKYLINNGVNKSRIIKEEKSTSTGENMAFSKAILDEAFKKDYSVVVITNNFHILRATSIAKNTGFKSVTHMHAGLQWYNLLPCYLRESLAVLKMFVLG